MTDFIIGLPPSAPSLGTGAQMPSGILVPITGRDGRGLNLAGVVANYAGLPEDLTESDAGQGYLVMADKLVYMWSGFDWPDDGDGLEVKGDTGDPGRGIESVIATSSGFRLTMTQSPTIVDVAVPALTAATSSAVAAAASATAAETARATAVTAADAADDHAATATAAATAADASADAAAASATTADASADGAATAAESASTSATAAAASATTAGTARDGAQTSATAAAASASIAATARDDAETARDNASTSAGAAAASETAAADSAADAQASAEAAAETVGTGIPNAEATIKGGVMLPGSTPGELGGTFEHPFVTGWADKADLSAVTAKYTKPAPGIPSSDLASAVTTSLSKADSAYQKPGPGIPKSDMTSAVQTSLGLADTAVQVDGSGKLPASIIPAVALTEFLGAVANQTSMLALTGQRGDWCTRTDTNTDWQLIAEPSSTLANWRERVYPGSPVSSVNGRTGTVTTTAADITDSTVTGRSVLTAASASAARSAIGAGTSSLALGTTSTTAAAGDDTRLSDTRTPTAGSVTNTSIATAAAIALSKLATGYVAGSDNSGARTLTLWVGTEAQYTAIGSKDSNTIYFRTA
ncbi:MULTISPECIES: phage upper tail fiber protein [Nocardia]|uniref:phage upper tail fiber protein n=1 Tax=Nocardia TaxID=1817 RepID=UPI001E624AB4|nr:MULTISPECIES: hypothetical protein [Nocardia]